VIAVQVTEGNGELFIGTRDGMAIRFQESGRAPMGRTAYGVRGITFAEDDYAVAMEVVRPGGTLLTVTDRGYGNARRWRSPCSPAAASGLSTSRPPIATARWSLSRTSRKATSCC